MQPLEGLGKSNTKEEGTVEIPTPEKPLPPAPPSSGEHVLPGGIGTYSISHISYFNQRPLKPEGGTFTVAQSSITDRNEENSNCSSYTGSGFTLWAESTVKKGKTGKENVAGDRHTSRGKVSHLICFLLNIQFITLKNNIQFVFIYFFLLHLHGYNHLGKLVCLLVWFMQFIRGHHYLIIYQHVRILNPHYADVIVY